MLLNIRRLASLLAEKLGLKYKFNKESGPSDYEWIM
jgi:hypothetical protein